MNDYLLTTSRDVIPNRGMEIFSAKVTTLNISSISDDRAQHLACSTRPRRGVEDKQWALSGRRASRFSPDSESYPNLYGGEEAGRGRVCWQHLNSEVE
jgi:hypothetical protein